VALTTAVSAADARQSQSSAIPSNAMRSDGLALPHRK
jgi:hypothetical protein